MIKVEDITLALACLFALCGGWISALTATSHSPLAYALTAASMAVAACCFTAAVEIDKHEGWK